jgi:Fur family ferric uptake transcriptional regulator
MAGLWCGRGSRAFCGAGWTVRSLCFDRPLRGGRSASCARLGRRHGSWYFSVDLSIGDIADHLPELPRSSAYRHLTDLESAGLVRRVAASDEFTRFELAEDLTERHHHLLCVNCGKVIDVRLPAGFEHELTSAISQLAGAEGFQPGAHRLDVLGTCADCG